MCIDRYLNEYEDIFKDQISNSYQIIISKTENLDLNSINDALLKIKSINDSAKIITGNFNEFGKDIFDQFINKEWIDKDLKKSSLRSDLNIENIGFTDISFDDFANFESYTGAIIREDFGENLI